MKDTRKFKETLGIGMICSACVLAVTFVILAIRKRSIFAAFAAVAAAEGVAGLWLLVDARSTPRACEEDEEDDELFTEDECAEVDASIRNVLGGEDDAEPCSGAQREVPRDEDATEADFQ